MSVVRLLVLGAVRRRGRAHGYQVRADLESWGAHEWAGLKPGSIYHALRQMAGQGLLRADEEAPSTAGGPPRIDYEITEAGEADYLALLRHALSSADQRLDMLSAGVGLMDDLPRDEAVDLLRARALALEKWRSRVRHEWSPGEDAAWGAAGEVPGMWVHTVESAAEWMRGLIERLERGAYVMAGEEPLKVVSRPGRGR